MTSVSTFLAAMVSPVSQKPEDSDKDAPFATFAEPRSPSSSPSSSVTLSPEARALERLTSKGIAIFLRPIDEDSKPDADGKSSDAGAADKLPSRKLAKDAFEKFLTQLDVTDGEKTQLRMDFDTVLRNTDGPQA